MTALNPPRPSTTASAPARAHPSVFRGRLDLARQADVVAAAAPSPGIRIRTVPQAAIVALVRSLVAEGVGHGG